jgi:hypothetical protein
MHLRTRIPLRARRLRTGLVVGINVKGDGGKEDLPKRPIPLLKMKSGMSVRGGGPVWDGTVDWNDTTESESSISISLRTRLAELFI